jgi:predicted small lipoprotein YifL
MKRWIAIGAAAAAAAGSVALVGCGTSGPVHAPPPELVGTWNGGAGDSTDWRLTIGPDGSYTLINDRLGLSDSGQVDTSNHGFNATGDARVLEAAGISGCDWSIGNSQDQVGDLYGYTFASLVFCDNATSAWIRF